MVVEVDGFKLGLSVCYDLRFPELYRALVDRGAEVLLVPAAFTLVTGKEHWHVLLRARAIESANLARRRRPVGPAPEGPRLVRPFADRRSLGHGRSGVRGSGRLRHGRHRARRSRRASARACRRCATAGCSAFDAGVHKWRFAISVQVPLGSSAM